MNRVLVVETASLREGLQSIDNVPRASDIDALFNYFIGYPNIIFMGLVINSRWPERALKYGAKRLSISILDGRTHQKRNAGKDKELET